MGIIFRVCRQCEQMKESYFLCQKNSNSDGLDNLCKDCRKKEVTTSYNKRKGKMSQKWASYNLRRYFNGIPAAIAWMEYEQLLIKADYKCQICGGKDSTKRLAIDHDHNTGKIRGVLCSKCNRALGYLNDNKELLQKAIAYLEK